ncbi:MAG: YtxH domain-containing protein, partial [Desulfosporosinus sp.]
DLVDLVSKEKRKKERVKVAQKLAVGMGVVAAVSVTTGILFAPKSGKETREYLEKKAVNTVETIKDTVQKKAETVKDSAAHAAKEAYNVIKDVQGKKEIVKKDIKDGHHEMTQDIHKTAEIISNEL